MARLNKPVIPVPGEVFKIVNEDWTLYKVPGDDRYKLVANYETEGSANYSLVIHRTKITKTADHFKLRSGRPFLYEDVEKAMGSVEALTGSDKYGDIALSSNKPLTAEQQWNRRVMFIREKYLIHSLSGLNPDPARAIKVLYPPIFGEDAPQSVIDEVTAYIKGAGPLPSEENLSRVLVDYYDGKYRPKSMETLAAKLDIIQGGFE